MFFNYMAAVTICSDFGAQKNKVSHCMLPYVKYIASPGLMHETGYSEMVHWDDLEGLEGGSRGRGHVYEYSGLVS